MATVEDLRKFSEQQAVLFVCDPTGGDQYVIGNHAQLEDYDPPPTAEDCRITTVGHVLATHDFGCYENGFELIVSEQP